MDSKLKDNLPQTQQTLQFTLDELAKITNYFSLGQSDYDQLDKTKGYTIEDPLKMRASIATMIRLGIFASLERCQPVFIKFNHDYVFKVSAQNPRISDDGRSVKLDGYIKFLGDSLPQVYANLAYDTAKKLGLEYFPRSTSHSSTGKSPFQEA